MHVYHDYCNTVLNHGYVGSKHNNYVIDTMYEHVAVYCSFEDIGYWTLVWYHHGNIGISMVLGNVMVTSTMQRITFILVN